MIEPILNVESVLPKQSFSKINKFMVDIELFKNNKISKIETIRI